MTPMPSQDRHGAPVNPTGHMRERIAAALYYAQRCVVPDMTEALPVDHAYPRFMFEPEETRAFYEMRADRFLLTLDDLGIAVEDRSAKA